MCYIDVIKRYPKEYFLLFLGLLIQSFFGFRVVSDLLDALGYFVVFRNIIVYLLGVLGFIVGSIIILYVGFLFLKHRNINPWRFILKFILIYCIGQIIVAFILGFFSLTSSNNWLLYCVSIFLQYFLRYFILVFVFVDAYKLHLKDIYFDLILGLFLVLFAVVVQCFISDYTIVCILVEACWYMLFIIYLHGFVLRRCRL